MRNEILFIQQREREREREIKEKEKYCTQGNSRPLARYGAFCSFAQIYMDTYLWLPTSRERWQIGRASDSFPTCRTDPGVAGSSTHPYIHRKCWAGWIVIVISSCCCVWLGQPEQVLYNYQIMLSIRTLHSIPTQIIGRGFGGVSLVSGRNHDRQN